MSAPVSPTGNRRVVIVGGGICGIALAKKLDKSCDVTVLERCTHYHCPIPSTRAIVDDTKAWQQFIPYDRSLKRGKVVLGEATGLLLTDPEKPKVLTAEGGCLDADALILAIGAKYAFPASRSAAPVKDQLAVYAKCKADLAAGGGVCVVGGGAVGVEVAGDVKAAHPSCAVTLVHSGADLLSNFGGNGAARTKLAAAAKRKLEKLGVVVVLSDRIPKTRFPPNFEAAHAPIPVPSGEVETAGGVKVPADLAFWCAGNAFDGKAVFDALQSDSRGKLKVDAFLRCEGQARVFAAGEIAAVGDGEYGVPGVKAMVGPCAANVLSALAGRAPKKAFKLPGALPGVLTVGPKAGIARLPFGTFTGSNFFANLKNNVDFFLGPTWLDVAGAKLPKARPQ